MPIEPVKLLFTRRRVLGSRAIQRFTWSRWSHVALVRDWRTIEALMFQGVGAQTVSHTLAGTSDHVFVAVPGVDSDRAWNFATRQIGKPYDYLSLAGLFFRRDWHVDDAWQCAELVTAALIEGGV